MLQDLAQILKNGEAEEALREEETQEGRGGLRPEEIDALLEEAWENSIVQPEECRRMTERALADARLIRYAKGTAAALRNRAYLRMLRSEYRKALEDAQQCLSLISEEEALLAGTTWDIVSLCYNGIGSYKTSVEAVYKSLSLFEACGYKRGIAWAHHNLGLIFTNIGDLNRAVLEYRSSLESFEGMQHVYGITRLCDLLSRISRKQGAYSEAMAYLKRAKENISPGEKTVQSFSLYLNWGITRRLMGHKKEAAEAFRACGPILKPLDNPELGALLDYETALLRRDLQDAPGAMALLERALKSSEAQKLKPQMRDIEKARSEVYELLGEPAKALACYKAYDRLSQELINSESLQNIRNLETQKEIELAEREKDYQRKLREETEKILTNVLPGPIVKELKTAGRVAPQSVPCATVLFTDFVGFTALASRISPEELVTQLDYCFSGFDRIMAELEIEKLKTIGDGYMAVAGTLDDRGDHAERCVRAGLRILDFMQAYRRKREAEKRVFWDVRIGIHSGPITAGVIGNKKFAYDVWGDTVNTASRMESGGHVGAVNITSEVYRLVHDRFSCRSIGEIKAKGKGMLAAFAVEGLKSP